MEFNFNKYDGRKFHNDVETDKKIKALFLYYDYIIIMRKLTLSEQITLISFWIIKFEEHELYEVIPSFKLRRNVLYKQLSIPKKTHKPLPSKKYNNKVFNFLKKILKNPFK